jgi:hypothetical protein
MLKAFQAGIAFFALLIPATAAPGTPYKIVTGLERGTYIQIGRDLARWIAEPAAIDLEVLPSKGSAENVQRMRFEPGVKFALVQSDVYQAFLDQAAAGNADARRIIEPLRVIMPLYDEEIYFVARADAPITYIHEIKNRKLGVGAIGSGTALTSTTLYRMMFGEAIADGYAQYVSNEEALVQLTVSKTIDVAIIVAGQPAKLFADMKPEARQFIKLLRLDDKAPEISRARKTYFPAIIRSESYPAWLKDSVPTLTVKAFLVTYDYGAEATRANLVRFADSLCRNFDALQAHGHPKWKEVRRELPTLGQGWSYYPPIAARLRACFKTDGPRGPRSCTQQEIVLGLCKN